MIDLLMYTLVIFIAGAIPFVESMLAIPFGIIAGVPTVLTIIVGFSGNLITVILLIRFVDIVWDRIRKRKERKRRNKKDAVSYASGTADQKEEQQIRDEAPIEDDFNQEAYTMESKRTQRAKKLWDKYGVPGLTFFGTGFLSSHVTVLMACLFGGNRVYIAMWMTISLAAWSLLVGVAVHFGMDAFFR